MGRVLVLLLKQGLRHKEICCSNSGLDDISRMIIGLPTYTRFEAVGTHDALEYPNTTTEIRPKPKYGAVQCEQDSFTSRRATRRKIRVPRVNCETPERILSFSPLLFVSSNMNGSSFFFFFFFKKKKTR
jgi:hypothetical protein